MIDFGVKKIVVTGTCYEYGLKEGLIYNTYKTNPVVEYAKAKVKLYRWLKNYQNVKIVVICQDLMLVCLAMMNFIRCHTKIKKIN